MLRLMTFPSFRMKTPWLACKGKLFTSSQKTPSLIFISGGVLLASAIHPTQRCVPDSEILKLRAVADKREAIEAYEKLKKEMRINSEFGKTADWDQLIFVVKAAIEAKRLREELIAAKQFEEDQLRQAVEADEALKAEAEKLFGQRERVIRAQCQKEFHEQVRQETELARNRLNDISKELNMELEKQLNDQIDIQNRAMVRNMVSKFRDLRSQSEDMVNLVTNVLTTKQNDFENQDRFVKENKGLMELREQCMAVEAALKIDKNTAPNWNEQTCQISELAECTRRVFHDGSDALGEAVLRSIPSLAIKRGVLTEIGLRTRFEQVEKVSHKLAMLKEEGPHPGTAYVASYIRSALIVGNKLCTRDLTSDFVPEDLDNADLLYRASACVKNNDFVNAVKFMERLRGAPTKAVAGWLSEAHNFLKVKHAINILKNYCTLKINRCCYKSPILVIDGKATNESWFK
ncbi:uncharacterized protein LOC135944897 [Cloeon dipterum]|uniref:uncharacterized protein LOC135944897 n=1 Tax=Cloeon dipterum TaxID=197152 RepID=UPI003220898F